MRSRLFVTVLSGYLLIIVLGAAGVYLSFREAASKEFRRYIFEGQHMMAARAETLITEYYKSIGSFKGLQEYLNTQYRIPRQGPNDRSSNRSFMGRHMMNPGRFVVTDENLRIIADTSASIPVGTKLPEADMNNSAGSFEEIAVPIIIGGSIRAYIIPYIAIDPKLPPEDRRVLSTIQQGSLLSLIVVLFVSIAAAVMLTLYIVRPIREVHRAVTEIGSGNFTARTFLHRKDEIGGLGEGVNKMAASLEEARIWRSQIISDTAHELRTPVSLLSGRLEMLSEGLYPTGPEEIEKLSGEVKRLGALIEQLENLSQLEHLSDSIQTKEQILYENIDLKALLGERVDAFTGMAKEKSITFTLSEMDSVFAKAEKARLIQVIDILFSNALRYTPENGIIAVHAALVDNPGENDPAGKKMVEFCIEDSGPGIPPEYREKVFRRYFRIDKSRSSSEGGRGLGLAIAMEIVRLHGGSIRVEEGAALGGARFCVQLPA